MTATVCLSLLLSGGPKVDRPSAAEETAAIEWLKSLNVHAPTQSEAMAALEQWQAWQNTTPQARAAHLALEMRSLSPASARAVFSLNQRRELVQLSAENLLRIQNRLAEKYPLRGQPSAADQTAIRQMTENIDFHYLSRYNVAKEKGVHAPLVSPRELAKRNLNFASSYYSKLVGTSSSVGFKVIATKKNVAPYSLNAQVPFDAYRLQSKLAQEEGFFVPDFSNPVSLISFFNEWEPELVETLLRQNRMSLPAGINTVEKFLAYMNPAQARTIFPDDKAYDRLAVLREQLHRFVLTENDLRAFLQWSFGYYLSRVALNDPQEFLNLTREFALAPGPQNIMAKPFRSFLNLGELTLRIPVAVGPQYYTILRIENQAYNPFPSREAKVQAPWDSRRLDHSAMP